MDETPVYMDTVPSKTVDVKGKKSIKVRTTKSERYCITAALSCTATGEMQTTEIHSKYQSDGTVVSF